MRHYNTTLRWSWSRSWSWNFRSWLQV